VRNRKKLTLHDVAVSIYKFKTASIIKSTYRIISYIAYAMHFCTEFTYLGTSFVSEKMTKLNSVKLGAYQMAGVRVIIRLLRRLAGYVLNRILAIKLATIVKLQALRLACREARIKD